MVALAKISDKSIHPQEGSNKQKEPYFFFFATWGHKIGRNSAVVHPTVFWLHPFCSSRDSASDEVILNKNGGRCDESEVYFAENEAVLFIAS